ncbi:MAG TPA: polyprenyl synthetase family protein [Candidatus Saccharimonadales bacterium]|nr:polyprenyl synthetase family protein [Candidatus Saccharimonadales bacterium]
MNTLDLSSVLNLPNLVEDEKKVETAFLQVLDTSNPTFKKLGTHYTKAKSKRLRSALVMVSAGVTGADIDDKVIAAGTSIELVHLSSLVHDDIMDGSSVRRGIPTANALEGDSQAILFGDFLLACAYRAANGINPESVELISKTIIELCDGQSRELKDLYNTSRSTASLFKAITGKTASLISASVSIGAISSKKDENVVDALNEFGRDFGIMFQLIDDLQDFISNQELLGKPVMRDVVEGNYNHPVIASLANAESDLLRSLLSKKREVDAGEVVNQIIKLGGFGSTIALIKQYCVSAEGRLKKLKKSASVDALANLPRFYMNWSTSKLTDKKYRYLVDEFPV